MSFSVRMLMTLPLLALAGLASGAESGLIAPNLRFTHLSIGDGMVAGVVRSILQDREGTVWIGTDGGLCRYDGYEVKIFRNLPSQGDSLSANSVMALVEDRDGAIWVGTEGGYLDRLDPKTGTFEHIRVTMNGSETSRMDGIRCLMLDKTRHLWIGSGDGVIRLGPGGTEAEFFKREDGGQWICNALLSGGDGTVWAASESGEILRFDEQAGHFHLIGDAGGRVNSLVEQKEGKILVVAVGMGLLEFDPQSLTPGAGVALTVIEENPGISAAVATEGGQIWTGTVDGLSHYDPAGDLWNRFRRDPLDPGSLLGSRVSCLFADRRGVLWVGFSSGGVSRFLMENPWFSKLAIADEGRSGLSGRSIDSVMEDSKGRIWIGNSGGLDCWDPVGTKMRNDILNEQFGGAANGHEVTAMMEDRSGRIWVGTREGTIFQPRFEAPDDSANDDLAPSLPVARGTITALLEDGKGNVWIGSRGGGIQIVSPEGRQVAEYLPGGPEGLKDRFIKDLCIDAEGTIWVGTSSEGVMRYNDESGHFESEPKLDVGEILDLFVDSKGILWVGSSGRGLTRLNLQSGEVLTINQRNSPSNNPLPDDTIRAIAEDASGFLWVSTDEGLARMDRETFEFRSFDEHDGLQARMFHSRAAGKDSLGRLLFGGPNGLTVIDPQRLPEPKRAERPILTGLELFGEPVFPTPGGILERPLAMTERINVPYARHNRIAFRFSTLDYTTPRRSLFRYQLEGADADWQMADDSRRAIYAGLPPGAYRFLVESSSDGLQWNADHAAVKLEIRPQWYALWYTRAALGAIAVLLSIYLFFHRIHTREEALRRQQEQLQVRYSKAEADLARHLQHAMLLEQTGLALGAEDGTEDLLSNALRQLGEAFGVARCYVRAGTVSAEGEGRDFRLVAEHLDPGMLGKRQLSNAGRIDSERFVGKLLRTDRALAVSDVANRPDLFPDATEFSDCGTQSLLAVRTSYLGQPNGYVVLQHCGANRDWQSDEIKLLESLAGQFGLVVAQLDQQERDEKQRRELEMAKQEADLANRSKSDFLAKMTHELRTPLNAIIGFSELLSDDTDLTRRQRETLDIINHSGEHLLGVINDILEISKIEAGKVELRNERFNLSNLLTSVYEMLAFGAKSKGLTFAIDKIGDLPGDIVADKGKLRQVLVNLVGNATKFTEQGGITVTVRATGLIPGTSRRVIGFEIRDTGPGIAADDLPKLFEKFHQTETGMKARRGTGLGLAISKAFVEMMEGQVEVASTVGVGTVFRFTILCEEAAGAGATAGEALSSELAAGGGGGFHPRRLAEGHPEIRVLIVEDQPANRLLASRILKAAGFVLSEAENGAEGVEKWRTFHPHLILMDEEMPVMRGREATRIIREESEGRGPIIVALTAFALDETRLAALSSGSDDFLAKPFRIDDLLGTIARHLPVEYQRPPAEIVAA
jgi:signal transduction histidine kinase/CheY-like chemotaxis protein/streptogramin lyase